MISARRSQDNPFVTEVYAKLLGQSGSKSAHHLLHTCYYSRKREEEDGIELDAKSTTADRLRVKVCVGTGCYLRGAHDLLQTLLSRIEIEGLQEQVNIQATFCMETCDRGPSVGIGSAWIPRATAESVMKEINRALNNKVTNALPLR